MLISVEFGEIMTKVMLARPHLINKHEIVIDLLPRVKQPNRLNEENYTTLSTTIGENLKRRVESLRMPLDQNVSEPSKLQVFLLNTTSFLLLFRVTQAAIPLRVVTHAFLESPRGWLQWYVIDRRSRVDYGHENAVRAFFKKFVAVGWLSTCNQRL